MRVLMESEIIHREGGKNRKHTCLTHRFPINSRTNKKECFLVSKKMSKCIVATPQVFLPDCRTHGEAASFNPKLVRNKVNLKLIHQENKYTSHFDTIKK